MLIHGNCLDVLPTLAAESVQCVVTSPPYFGLRDYGHADQIGLELTPDQYVTSLVDVFRRVWRVLREDGTLWLNLGDSYANDGKWGGATGGKHAKALRGEPIGRMKKATGLKPKNLIGIPWRVAFALQADGWWLRSDIIWHKPNPMPEPVTDRPTKAHEYVFLLAKSARYFYDGEAVAELAVRSGDIQTFGGEKARNAQGNGGDPRNGHRTDSNSQWGKTFTTSTVRNRRSVWTIATAPYKGSHFATFPPKLVEPCILAGCPVGGTVLDPFAGSGTVGAVARATGREFIGIEINAEYVHLAEDRIASVQPPLLAW